MRITAQGSTVVSYRSASTAGVVEAIRTCRVRIDSITPEVTCYGRAFSWQGGTSTFRFRVDDPATGTVRAKLVITRYGRPMREYQLGKCQTGRPLHVTIGTGLGVGTWNWRVVAYDPAGGRTAGKYRHLEVYPR